MQSEVLPFSVIITSWFYQQQTVASIEARASGKAIEACPIYYKHPSTNFLCETLLPPFLPTYSSPLFQLAPFHHFHFNQTIVFNSML